MGTRVFSPEQRHEWVEAVGLEDETLVVGVGRQVHEAHRWRPGLEGNILIVLAGCCRLRRVN